MPRPLPTSPLAFVLVVYRVWRRLPPAQRRRLLAAAVVYGPQLAARATLLRRQALRAAAGSAGRFRKAQRMR